MALKTMYPSKAGSPIATTTVEITQLDTTIYISDLSILNTPPNLITLKTSNNVWERCRYVARQASTGSGWVTIQRTGVEHASSDTTGVALAWPIGTKVYRGFGDYDYTAMLENIQAKVTIPGETYSGKKGQVLVVNQTEDGVETIASVGASFLEFDANGDITPLTTGVGDDCVYVDIDGNLTPIAPV